MYTDQTEVLYTLSSSRHLGASTLDCDDAFDVANWMPQSKWPSNRSQSHSALCRPHVTFGLPWITYVCTSLHLPFLAQESPHPYVCT